MDYGKEIGELFGGLHYGAVSKAAARLEKELSKDKDLAKLGVNWGTFLTY